MSTRATYLIAADGQQDVCFYIHYDGYHEGAAGYLLAMIENKTRRAGFAGRFLRANGLAEFTHSHDAHFDTEYRYTLENDGRLTVEDRKGWENSVWVVSFHGNLEEFILTHANVPLIKIDNDLYTVRDAFRHTDYLRLEAIIAAQRFGYCANTDSGFDRFASAAEQLIAGTGGVDSPLVDTLKAQLHTLADIRAGVKIELERYRAMSNQEILTLLEQRNTPTPELFASALGALTAQDYADQFNLQTVKVKVRGRSEYTVPAHCDMLDWLNRNAEAEGRDLITLADISSEVQPCAN